MKEPKLRDIERLSRAKGPIIDKQKEKLLSTATRLDRGLYDYIKSKIIPKFTFDTNGRVKNTNTNIDASRNIKQLSNYIKGNVDKEMKQFYLSSAKNTIEASNRYYNLFRPTKELKNLARSKSEKTLRRTIVNIFAQSNIQSQIENVLASSVSAGAREQEIEQAIEDLVIGKEGKMGVTTRFHYGAGYDNLQAQGRTTDAIFATTLKLNYAIYTGGLITETRDFCTERNGNVYLREEIESWQDEDWQGKKAAHVILADAGGYNCRHYYAWISYELAKRLRKDIERSIYDKK